MADRALKQIRKAEQCREHKRADTDKGQVFFQHDKAPPWNEKHLKEHVLQALRTYGGQRRSRSRNISYVAMFSALGGVLMLLEIPLFFAPGFYKMDLSELPVLMSAFYLGPVAGVITELQNALACAARIFELIEETPQIPDQADAAELGHVAGNLSISDVSFSYVPDRKLIEHLNLIVKPGQRIAIVGPTGCGKTTVINLLMRFYDVDQGSISVEGKDIRNVTRHSLRSSYGMVLQETWLKAGTIRENICMGKPDATEEELLQASKAAHAHSFIKRLPQGYNTVIGEDGGSLSQGQKQLLCIARVMLCLPPMLILDEATSSIDTRTELKIQEAFSRMMQGRTSFIVAHRLSTIREADVILVMQDGHIIEQGNHDTLLAKNGFYANLYNSQFAR